MMAKTKECVYWEERDIILINKGFRQGNNSKYDSVLLQITLKLGVNVDSRRWLNLSLDALVIGSLDKLSTTIWRIRQRNCFYKSFFIFLYSFPIEIHHVLLY